jgi:uncharacterized protein (TIGR03437 family)
VTVTSVSFFQLYKRALVAFIWLAACCQQALTQPVPVSVLQIEVRDVVRYNEDLSDVTKFASNPSATPPTLPRNFYEVIHIGDIVAVNGSPARGTYITRLRNTNTMLDPNPGEAVADTSVAGLSEVSFDILTADSRPIGSLFGMGLSRASPAPGAPLAVSTGNHVIVGGSGAFLGARGYFGQAVSDQTIPIRNASISEDPANRRKNGGGRILFLMQVIPYIPPQIVITSSGPAVFHPDFSPVNTARPAAAGEILIVRASGLGPTRPGVDPGQPFPSDVFRDVNAPVAVNVNGHPAQVLNAFGWPGTLDNYRVDFQVPDGTGGPTAAIQLTAGFISSAPVSIPVQ